VSERRLFRVRSANHAKITLINLKFPSLDDFWTIAKNAKNAKTLERQGVPHIPRYIHAIGAVGMI
jgi:hypothetical protein